MPVDAEPHLVVTQLDYDQQSGRFTAILSVTGTTMDPVNLRIAGRAEDTVDVPVATARLPMGTVLHRGRCAHGARAASPRVHRDVVHALADAVGMQLRQPVAPGRPLARAALMRPALVQRGSAVRIELHAGGLSVAAQGVARQSGAIGERIRVMNTGSRAIIEAVVSGPDTVRALPNSMPLSVRRQSGTRGWCDEPASRNTGSRPGAWPARGAGLAAGVAWRPVCCWPAAAR